MKQKYPDLHKLFDKAQELTKRANSEKEYKAAARAWEKLKFDGVDFYFQDKVDYCLDMAAKCKQIEDAFKEWQKREKVKR